MTVTRDKFDRDWWTRPLSRAERRLFHGVTLVTLSLMLSLF